MFGTGAPNEAFAEYFTGDSFLNPLTQPGESAAFRMAKEVWADEGTEQ